MTVVMVVMPMVVMPMVMMTVAARAGIGPAQRIERLHRFRNGRAKAFQHISDDVVAQDNDALRFDRGRQMAVAEMPGQLRQMNRIPRTHLVNRLGWRHDADMPAIVQRQQVAVMQRDRLQQVHQHLPAVPQRQHAPPEVPFVMLQHRDIETDASLQQRG